MCSIAGHLPPEWVLKQDANTIEFLSETCEKIYDYNSKYKLMLIEMLSKRGF